jgi:cellulose synthase/poly-beta-1,6-N-acetylglucosamine synthase-like glycosyltransferase
MIGACVDSCLRQTRPADQIVVVNDGSTDATGDILRAYGPALTVITAEKATGNKSRAQELGIKHITGDIVIATDGDTILDPGFIAAIEDSFKTDPTVSVVSGYVQSTRYNVLTALREIDYTIGQDLFKRAQAHLHFLLVIPGCAGAFKTELFHSGIISFEHDTLTEDLDFTYKLNTLGKKISFNYDARVYTQDPPTLHSYVNQMRRWYGGGWQNLKKHFSVIASRPSAAFVLSTTYLEGTLFNIALFTLPFLNLSLFAKLMVTYLGVGMVMGLYAALRKRRLDLFLVSPLIPLMTVINAYVLLEQFVKEIILRRTNMTWFHPERKSLFEGKDNNFANI